MRLRIFTEDHLVSCSIGHFPRRLNTVSRPRFTRQPWQGLELLTKNLGKYKSNRFRTFKLDSYFQSVTVHHAMAYGLDVLGKNTAQN